METRTRRRRSTPKYNTNTLLLGLILLLAVALVVVLCIALGGDAPSAGPSDSTTTEAGSTTTVPGATTQYVGLTVSEPAVSQTVVLEKDFVFRGTSDPGHSLTLNGQEVERESDGSFAVSVELEQGVNTFTFVHKNDTLEFSVEYRTVVQSFEPAGDQTYNSGATINFKVFAREGSTVEAAFNGQTVTLEADNVQAGTGAVEGFVYYTGTYTLPSANDEDRDMGAVTYTVVCNGVTETYTSGIITCLKAADVSGWDPGVTPDGGSYINVGSGYICEIITYAAETFDGNTQDDYSHPTNNYLPEGTVDYCSTQLVERGTLKYAVLRSGHRVYLDKKNTPASGRVPVIDRYAGQLPDHQEIGVASFTDTGSHLVLTLDCLWKAPFYFDLLPQEYYYPDGGSSRNYSVTACTATYIDITFCYATVFTGTVELPADNPLFRSAEVIKNESDYTLRLHLKKTGGFYGWDSYYNDKDQLCFQFLKPAKVTAADNAYGADLTGVTVMIDVGHGGIDGGAVGTDANGNQVEEADRNLALAFALKEELESIGATVVMDRTDDSRLTVDERILMLKETSPDICISVHHNSIGGYPNINGLEVYYYTPFSERASELIHLENQKDSVYKSSELNWHHFFLARETVCPVVLMESGYMTSPYDVANMLDPDSLAVKAQAMTRGIVAYFLEISK